MRIRLILEPRNGSEALLEKPNLYLLQAMVYNLFSSELGAFLHDQGYVYEKRHFKLFVFSWLRGEGKPRTEGSRLCFSSPLSLDIASPFLHVLQDVAFHALSSLHLRLGNNELRCSGVEVFENEVEEKSITLRTLSPITCYSTLLRPEGKKFTVYHEPEDSFFQEILQGNLEKKFRLIFPEEPLPSGKVRLLPRGRYFRKISRFRPEDPVPIKGYSGIFTLEGPRELLQIALDAGLGAKNSAGWGCVERVQ